MECLVPPAESLKVAYYDVSVGVDRSGADADNSGDTGSTGGAHSAGAVLHNDGVVGRCVEAFGGQQVSIRRWFAVGYTVCGDSDVS